MTTFNTAAVSLILFFYSLSIHAFPFSLFFFFNDTATTEIYTLSLHDALPILYNKVKYNPNVVGILIINPDNPTGMVYPLKDRKSTRLNSSHTVISYAVFCLKKKKNAYFVAIYPNDFSRECKAQVQPVGSSTRP